MNKKFYILALMLFFTLQFNTQLYCQDLTAAEIFEKVNDAVVVIYGYDKDGKTISQGSGVVISDNGMILTNYHVISGCEKFAVSHNNTIFENTSLNALDYENDLVILKTADINLKKIETGNSDILKVGEKVYAIGSPLGLENTLSEGIISGLRNTDNKYRDKIQITASVSSGSSGGAVVNVKGELIGISSSQIKSGQNLNFAVPVNKAITLLDQTINNPEISEAYIYFFKGISAYFSSTNNDAITNFSEVIRLMPDSTLGYRFRGLTYESMYLDEKALADYSKAIEINPNDDDAYRFRASFYIEREQYSNAIEDMNKAIAIYENSAYNFKYRGKAYYYLENYSSALSDLNKSIELDDTDYETFFLRAQTYLAMLDVAKTLADYEKTITLSPDYYDAYYSRARLYMILNENDKAIKDLEKCSVINPEESTQFNNLGWLYFDKKDYPTADFYLHKAFKLNNEDWDALLGASIVYFVTNDYETAEKLLKAAIKIEPRLKKGMNGLKTLEDEGFFYTDNQKKLIKKLFEEFL